MPKLEAFTLFGRQDNFNQLIRFLNTPDKDGKFPLPRLRRIALNSNSYWKGSLKGFEKRYEGIECMNCVIPPPLKEVEILDCPIVSASGFNAAKRLFKKYGTKFRLENDEAYASGGYAKQREVDGETADDEEVEDDETDDVDIDTSGNNYSTSSGESAQSYD